MPDYVVEVQPDFLERQTQAQPIAAVAELIWNSLDADAENVTVDFERDPLFGLRRIIITDDGDGIAHAEAPSLFSHLGGSWKKLSSKTRRKGRQLHGKAGGGRFKVLSLGRSADWKSVYVKDGEAYLFEINLNEDRIKRITIGEERKFEGSRAGVTLVVDDLKRQFVSLMPDRSVQEFAEIFAIYLKNYRGVSIRIDGERIEPEKAISRSWQFELTPICVENEKKSGVELEIIEWRAQTKRALFLCDAAGFPLTQVHSRFHVGDFQFSAYIKSEYMASLADANRIELAQMLPEVNGVIEEARKLIKELFRKRSSERARVVVDDWKAQKVYPFEGEAENQLDRTRREVFDMVAVTVQEVSPEFSEAPRQQMALHLRMLRHAMERSPSELHRILDEVLRLPKRKQKELASLLDEVELSGVISASTMVSDRLKFLQALRIILFDKESKKRLRERSQLHKILETYTWIFGEEFNLWASDRELTTVLKMHKQKLDPNLVVDEPVKLVNREFGIVDMMLSRAQRRHRSEEYEHLVIELKAPKVVLSSKELTQIKDYAHAVSRDPRYHRVRKVRWHFWLISDEYDEFVADEIASGPDPDHRLVNRSANVTIGVKTWGEILDENKARLQFVQEALQHTSDDDQAIAFIRERHSEFLEGVVIEGESDEDGDLTQDAARQGEAAAE